jgi:hypothetical protein
MRGLIQGTSRSHLTGLRPKQRKNRITLPKAITASEGEVSKQRQPLWLL